MQALLKTVQSLKTDRRAVTALEYGLIAALIAGVIIVAVTNLGTEVNNMFTNLNSTINTSGAPNH